VGGGWQEAVKKRTTSGTSQKVRNGGGDKNFNLLIRETSSGSKRKRNRDYQKAFTFRGETCRADKVSGKIREKKRRTTWILGTRFQPAGEAKTGEKVLAEWQNRDRTQKGKKEKGLRGQAIGFYRKRGWGGKL